jgi:hypothetical protein
MNKYQQNMYIYYRLTPVHKECKLFRNTSFSRKKSLMFMKLIAEGEVTSYQVKFQAYVISKQPFSSRAQATTTCRPKIGANK